MSDHAVPPSIPPTRYFNSPSKTLLAWKWHMNATRADPKHRRPVCLSLDDTIAPPRRQSPPTQQFNVARPQSMTTLLVPADDLAFSGRFARLADVLWGKGRKSQSAAIRTDHNSGSHGLSWISLVY